ncbi:hypothetical protein D3C80_1936930 [compost metagenome]
MEETAPGIECHRFELDAVAAGAQRAVLGLQPHLEELGRGRGDPVGELERVGIGQRLLELAADMEVQNLTRRTR